MKKINLFLGLVLVMFFGACGFEQVDTGHRGIETRFGKVVSDSLPEGLYFYNPATSDIKEIDVRVQTFNYDIECYTKDIQQASIKIGILANVRRDAAHLLFRDYGSEWDEKILQPVATGTIKTVIGKWDAVDLVSNREKARLEIEEVLKITLSEKNIELNKIELVNIDYNDQFEKAVENKVTAIQAAIEAQNRTKQISEEANQRVISAKAEAESMRIRANALTQNKSLVEYEAVQKWNGVLPVYNMGNSTPFINIGANK